MIEYGPSSSEQYSTSRTLPIGLGDENIQLGWGNCHDTRRMDSFSRIIWCLQELTQQCDKCSGLRHRACRKSRDLNDGALLMLHIARSKTGKRWKLGRTSYQMHHHHSWSESPRSQCQVYAPSSSSTLPLASPPLCSSRMTQCPPQVAFRWSCQEP